MKYIDVARMMKQADGGYVPGANLIDPSGRSQQAFNAFVDAYPTGGHPGDALSDQHYQNIAQRIYGQPGVAASGLTYADLLSYARYTGSGYRKGEHLNGVTPDMINLDARYANDPYAAAQKRLDTTLGTTSQPYGQSGINDGSLERGIAAEQARRNAITSGMTAQEATKTNEALDAFARQRAQASAAARQGANARWDAFMQGQRAQTTDRATRVNNIIDAQKKRDQAWRDNQLSVPSQQPQQPTSSPVPWFYEKSYAQAQAQDKAIEDKTFKLKSGYANVGGKEYGTRKDPGIRTLNHGQTMLGANVNGIKERPTAQGYRTQDGKWHPIA